MIEMCMLFHFTELELRLKRQLLSIVTHGISALKCATVCIKTLFSSGTCVDVE